MDELRPCPFCGGEAKLRFFHIKPANAPELKQWSIEHECVAMRSVIFSNECEADAIKAWNTRHESTCRIMDENETIHKAGDSEEFYEPAGVCSECGDFIPIRSFCPTCGARVIS